MSVLETNLENFANDVLTCSSPVMVDFWAEWCGPCKAIAPIIDEIANDRNDIKIVKVNVDKNAELATRYAIRGIPTLLLFNKGEVIANKVGGLNKADLSNWIDENLND